MIYGVSFLLLLLGMVVAVPALSRMMYMLSIKKNSATTIGIVMSTKSAMGWMWAADFDNQDRP